jgi:hypothetical protein
MIEIAVAIWLYRPQIECAREWIDVRRAMPFEQIDDMTGKYRSFMRACLREWQRS